MRRRAAAAASLSLLCAVAFGCRIGTADRAATSAAVRDSSAIIPTRAERTPNAALPESLIRRVMALEDSAAADTLSAEAPRRLWRLAKLYAEQLSPIVTGEPSASFAEKHQAAFDYWEPSGTYEYNGLHYRLLLWRFPDHPLADKAAWELSKLRQVGECEGWVACYIDAALGPAREFLERFPKSPLAEDAVRRANAAFDSTLAIGAHVQPGEIWDVDSAAIRALIAGYDSTARELPPILRARAMPTLDRLRSAWGKPRADSTRPADDGFTVQFSSESCHIRFKHPSNWRVVEVPAPRGAGWCALYVMRGTAEAVPYPLDATRPASIRIRTLPVTVDQAISPWQFRRIDGQWYATSGAGDRASARTYLGAQWHGVRADQAATCRPDGASAAVGCTMPLVVVGTSQHAANIEVGAQAVSVFELLLRTLVFF